MPDSTYGWVEIRNILSMRKIRNWQKLLLYIVMLAAAVLALYQVTAEKLPFAVGIASYVLAALTFFPGAYYLITDIVFLVKEGKRNVTVKMEGNRLTRKWIKDKYAKAMIHTLPETITSVLYAVYNGVLGVRYSSPWLGAMSAYYIILAVMRLGAIIQNQRITKIADKSLRMKIEDGIYRRNSMLFIGLAVVLGGVVVLLLKSIGGKTYGEYTIFIVALFSFYKVIKAFIHMAKDRKNHSPLITIILKVDYIDSFVSILMLQTALLTAFGNGQTDMIHTFNLFTGVAVCIMILIAGVQGILVSNKRRKAWKEEEKNDSYISSRR